MRRERETDEYAVRELFVEPGGECRAWNTW